MHDRAEAHPIVEFFAFLSAGKRTIFLTTLVFLCLGITYLRIATPRYEAAVVVAENTRVTPTSNQQIGLVFSRSSVPVTDFSQFIFAIRSTVTAEELAEDPQIMRGIYESEWDEESNQWRQPEGRGKDIRDWLRSNGIISSEWRAPDADRLRGYVANNVTIESFDDVGMTQIAFSHPDPVFAKYFITKLIDVSREIVLSRIRADLDQQIAYIESKINEQASIAMQAALIREWNDKTAKRAILQDRNSYPAIIVDERDPGFAPDYPRSTIVILPTILLGVLVGMLIALVRRAYRVSA